jgi:hypothetical protein
VNEIRIKPKEIKSKKRKPENKQYQHCNVGRIFLEPIHIFGGLKIRK